MKNFKIQKGSSYHFGDLLLSSVLLTRRTICMNVLFYLLVAGTPLFSSCSRATLEKKPSGQELKDSLLIELSTGIDSLKSLDLLLYEGTQLHSLLGYCRIDKPGSEAMLLFELEEKQICESCILVALANFPSKPPLASVQRYEAAKLLKGAFLSEDPKHPMMAGEFSFCIEATKGRYSPQDVVKIELQQLLSYVELSAVSNSMDGYELLEEPRVRLRNINSSASLLQKDGFGASEWIEEGEWAELGCDIGFYTQHPRIRLPCYPVSDKSSPIHTELELECRIEGERHSFVVEIPLIGKGACVGVELNINGAEDYSSIIH